MHYYYNRIHGSLREMIKLSTKVLPSNWRFISLFSETYLGMSRIRPILAGALGVNSYIPWNNDLFQKFKPYVDEQETNLKRTLETVKYVVDSPSTVSLLLGSGRLEKVLFDLFCWTGFSC